MKGSARTGPVTIKQVAEAAGVHFSTVSRALKPGTRHRVNPQIASRILETAQRLGYRTNTLASSLRTRRSYVVGVIVPDIASLLFPPILEGIEETLLREGYMTIVANSANDPERQRRILCGHDRAAGRRADPRLRRRCAIRSWPSGRTRAAPIVLMNRTDDTRPRAGGHQRRHPRHRACRAPPRRARPQPHRPHRGAQAGSRPAPCARAASSWRCPNACAPAGSPSVIEAEAFTREAGRAACARLSNKRRTPPPSSPPTICSRSAATTRSPDRNVNCPDEMSITGYNDAPFIDMVSPPLTTVRIRQREMGIEAARVLLARMNGQEIAADALLRPELIVRAIDRGAEEARRLELFVQRLRSHSVILRCAPKAGLEG